ncbi:MAG: C25 family cysteine peptidase [Promethearchaeota archaeon]
MAKLLLKTFVYSFLLLLIFFPFLNLFLYYYSEHPNVNDLDFSSNNIDLSNNFDIDLSLLPEINYEALNIMWYNPKIEMLIISPNKTDFINVLEPLIQWKNEKGVKTVILTNFSLYQGVDDAEKIRNMIKSYYEKENINWVLLAGDAQNDLIPIRYVYNPDVLRWGEGAKEAVGDDSYKPTDFYYADLTGSWDNDGDGDWGEGPVEDNDYGLDEISWIPEVYVGRFPADTSNELEIMVNKTLEYEMDPDIGSWMNRMLLAGGISSYVPQEYESHLTDYIIQNYAKFEVNYTHLVEEGGNLTQSNLISSFNNGYSTVIMAGHGSPTAFYRNPSRIGYTSSDASSSTNNYMPSLVYLDACSTSCYDVNDNNLGEVLIKKINGGAIGAIGALRFSYYFENDDNLEKLNRGNAKLFWEEFFLNKKFQQGRALYDSKVSYINSDYYQRGEGSTDYDFERKNILTYCLLGDPEVDIYTNKPQNALNPFTDNIYQGQLVSLVIRDNNNQLVPNARIHFKTLDGIYYTVYADANGVVKFRVPMHSTQLYNVTITGHNLIPSNFNFMTLTDNSMPELREVICNPQNPTTADTIYFNIKAFDNYSGLESVYLFLSKDNFKQFTNYSVSNGILDDDNLFMLETENLKPGKYSYLVLLRDYANNTKIIYKNSFNFTISIPLINYILPISLVVIIGAAGISIFIFYKGMQTYLKIIRKVEGHLSV